ncbi:GntR family transcriptional regulator [Acrocarpospora sp. B8E8]|uniref:GntR family transcriptional regulator n=1 Tax=Acrocarpospora sp. B8E8 TaxID=3153572 RepID=UPI00325D84A4
MATRAGAIPASTFARPLRYRGNLPLRVAVYSEVAGAIRGGVLGPGQLLPSEPELSSAFAVSRSVMREALILLEEDGLIRNQRGIGRFVVDVLPAIGLEQLQPIERMLAAPGPAYSVRRRKANLETSTDFTQRGLHVPDDAVILMWESLIVDDGVPLALAQEWVQGEDRLAASHPGLKVELEERHADPVSMLAVLSDRFGAALGPGSCEVSVSTAGSERAHALEVASASPVLVLTQRVLLDGSPIYVAKHLIAPEAGHLTVVQTSSP